MILVVPHGMGAPVKILIPWFFLSTTLELKPGLNNPSKREKFLLIDLVSSFMAKPSIAELSNGGLSYFAKISFENILFMELLTLTRLLPETGFNSDLRSQNSLIRGVNLTFGEVKID